MSKLAFTDVMEKLGDQVFWIAPEHGQTVAGTLNIDMTASSQVSRGICGLEARLGRFGAVFTDV